MAKYTDEDIRSLAGIFNFAKGNGTPFAVLTGAGCSVTAGIPLASGILGAINASGLGHTVRQRLRVPNVERAPYGKAMAALNSEERKQIIGPFLQNAKINWGHIALALLMKHGYVSRVLTFNFDSVLVRACGLIGLYPAIYDFSVVPDNKGRFNYIAQPSIIHLHGQGTSLAMMNSEAETEKHADLLRPLFQDTVDRFDLLVTGYSGLADGAFVRLCDVFNDTRRLYWLARDEGAEPEHIARLTQSPGGMVDYWGGADFDSVMVELAQALGIFPPTIFTNPAQHLLEEVEAVIAPPDGLRGGQGLLENLRKKLAEWSSVKLGKAALRREQMLKRNWKEAIELGPPEKNHPEDIHNLAWAHVMTAIGFAEVGHFEDAFLNFRVALQIKPDMHEAFNNWGNALGELARLKRDGDLFSEAFEKYSKALELKPDKHETLCNWANTLSELALINQEERVFKLAYEKYAQALAIKGDMHEALNNWGSSLGSLAKLNQDEGLFKEAFEKYAAALAIKPDKHETFNNWGNDLSMLAVLKQEEEMFQAAFEKYKQALSIKPDMHEALNNWGGALGSLANMKNDEEVFFQAFEKYAQALVIKPDMHEALNNWAGDLVELAQVKHDELMFHQAFDKFEQALAIKPDKYEAMVNWGNGLGTLAQLKQDESLFKQAFDLYAKALAIKPNHYEALSFWASHLGALADMKRDQAIFKQAFDKYSEALAIRSDRYQMFENWATTLLQSFANTEDKAQLIEAEEKSKRAEVLSKKPSYNLACVYARKGQEDLCHKQLLECKKAGTIHSSEHLKNDPDFAAYRGCDWFKALVGEA